MDLLSTIYFLLTLFGTLNVGLWSIVGFFAYKYRVYVKICVSLLRGNNANIDSFSFLLPNEQQSKEASVFSNGKVLKIPYRYMGRNYTAYVPFYRNKMAKMTNVDVSSIDINCKKEFINQQPGVPYLVTPSQLGAEKVEIVSLDGDSRFYCGDQLIDY